MLDLKALPTLRANMREFINADPISITIQRPSLLKQNGGWIRGNPVTLNPQRVRMTTFKRRLSHFAQDTVSGTTPVLGYVLTGFWNCDIRRNDEFDYNGDHYIVVSTEPKTDDRTRTDRVVIEVMIQVGDKAPPS